MAPFQLRRFSLWSGKFRPSPPVGGEIVLFAGSVRPPNKREAAPQRGLVQAERDIPPAL